MKHAALGAVLVAWAAALYGLALAVRGPDGWSSFFPLCFAPLLIEIGGSKRTLPWWAVGWLAMFLFGVFSGTPAISWIGAFGLLDGTLRTFGVRLGWRFGILLLVSPPFLLKLDIMLGYHLRDNATTLALKILKIIDPMAGRTGNSILFSSHTYYVERLCEGLKSFSALVTMLLVISKRYSTAGVWLKASAGWFAMVTIAIGLWFLANAVRIVALVVLDLPPESRMHEVCGVFAFVCIVLFPIVMIAELYFNPRLIERKLPSFDFKDYRPALLISVSVAILSFVRPHVDSPPATDTESWPSSLASYSRIPSVIDGKPINIPDIAAFQSGQQFLVVKRNLSALRFSHHPMQCWSALGYQVAGEASVSTPSGNLRRVMLHDARGEYALNWYYLIMTGPSFHVSDSEITWRLASLFHGAQIVQVNELRQLDSEEGVGHIPGDIFRTLMLTKKTEVAEAPGVAALAGDAPGATERK